MLNDIKRKQSADQKVIDLEAKRQKADRFRKLKELEELKIRD